MGNQCRLPDCSDTRAGYDRSHSGLCDYHLAESKRASINVFDSCYAYANTVTFGHNFRGVSYRIEERTPQAVRWYIAFAKKARLIIASNAVNIRNGHSRWLICDAQLLLEAAQDELDYARTAIVINACDTVECGA